MIENDEFTGMKDIQNIDAFPIPDEIPILPLRDLVVYPSMVSPLIIARPKSVKMINEVMNLDKMLGLVAQRFPETLYAAALRQ